MIKIIGKIAPIIIIQFMIIGASFSQEQDSKIITKNTTPNLFNIDEFTSLVIPPLNVLIENSKKNPTIEFHRLRGEEEQLKLKSVKRTWMNYIKFNAMYQYGMLNDISSFSNTLNPSISNTQTLKAQSTYSVGASISLPLSEIFDGKNKTRQQRLILEQTQCEKESALMNQKLQIIDAYTSTLEAIANIEIISGAVAVSNAQYQMAQADFINGAINASGLSAQKNTQIVNQRAYEQNKAMLINSILRLEVLSHTQIIGK